MAFERYMALRKSGGNHCHVNVLPIPAAAAAGARKVRDLAAVHRFFAKLHHLSGGPQF